MILYAVMKRVEEVPDEDPIKLFPDQKDAFNYMKTLDPDNTKDLMIYVTEV